MTGITNTITRSLAPVLVMAALIAPTVGAYRAISSQDMRDVAEPRAPASGRHDLRSQDALDAARSLPPDQLAAVAEGLRSGADGSDVGLVPGDVLDLVRLHQGRSVVLARPQSSGPAAITRRVTSSYPTRFAACTRSRPGRCAK